MHEADGSAPMCNCLEFAPDGKSIITGWTDGRVRAFTPQSGRLLYAIADVHGPSMRALTQASGITSSQNSISGVTCLSVSASCDMLLTGGSDNEVRLWQIGRQT